MNKTLLLFTLSLFTTFCAYSQEIDGYVIDSIGKPIEYATVALFTSDSLLAEGTATDAAGHFRVQSEGGGAGYLRISSVGYATEFRSLPLREKTIVLREAGRELDEVQVTARKRLTKKTDTGILYNMSANERAQSDNLLQALRYVPTLEVSHGGQISVLGTASPRIYLNGRPYEMAEANPAQVLQSLPAKRIKSIKVITKPDAAYGNTYGQYIVDIITEKNALDGTYTNVNLRGNTQPYTDDGILFMAKKNALDFSLNYNYNLNGQHNQPIKQEFRYGDSSSFVDSRGDGNWQTHIARLLLKYQIDSLNIVYADLHGKIQDTNLKGTWFSYDDADRLLPTDHVEQDNNDVAGTVETNAIYRNYYRNRPSVERFSAGYSYTYNPDKRHFTYTYFGQEADSADLEKTDGAMKEHTLNASYFLPLGSLHSLRGTARQIFRKGDTQSSDRSDIDYKQRVTQSTLSYNGQLSRVALYSQLQCDYATTRMSLPYAKESYRDNDFQLLPSAGLSWNVNQRLSLDVSYRKSIARPDIVKLNPFYNIQTSHTASQGNPNLKPEKTHTVSATAVLNLNRFFLQCTASAHKVNDVIMYYNKSVDDNGRVLSTYDNLGSRRDIGAELFASWFPTSFMSVNAFANAYHGKMDCSELALDQSYNTYNVYLSANFYLPKSWTLQGNYSTYKNMPSAWSTISSGRLYSVRIDKSWMNGALTAGIEVNSPFSKYNKLRQTTTREDFTQVQRNYITARSFGIRLSYTFNSGKKVNLKRDKSLKNSDQKTGVE